MKSILRSAGFWIGLVLLCLATDLLVLRIRGKLLAPRLLTVDGLLLGAAVVLVFLFQCTAYIRSSKAFVRSSKVRSVLRRIPFLEGVTRGVLFGLPLLLLLASLGPGIGSVDVQRQYVITPPSPPAVNNMGTVVMFPNGLRKIPAKEAIRLKQELQILNRCNVSDLRVVGFASSAPYAVMNEERNLRLANLRAGAVVKALENVQVKARLDSWPTYQEMTAQRRIRDTDTTGKRIERLQALNRRAEILWREGLGCAQ